MQIIFSVFVFDFMLPIVFICGRVLITLMVLLQRSSYLCRAISEYNVYLCRGITDEILGLRFSRMP